MRKMRPSSFLWPALYLGGSFLTGGSYIARWDGTQLTPLGSGMNQTVRALTVFDDGGGPALYAGGRFGKKVARWDGSSWVAMGTGMDAPVNALASWTGPGGPALVAGGEFVSSPGGDAYLALWGCKPRHLR